MFFFEFLGKAFFLTHFASTVYKHLNRSNDLTRELEISHEHHQLLPRDPLADRISMEPTALTLNGDGKKRRRRKNKILGAPLNGLCLNWQGMRYLPIISTSALQPILHETISI